MTTLSSPDPSFSVGELLRESNLIYWLLSGVMGHLQVITLAEWYFIAPDSAVNQT